jgi:membrane associated rhomboid family serine protease
VPGKFRVTYNAPVVLSFALLAVIVQLLPDDAKLWFAAWPEFHDARSYVGLISHVLGHANWDHLLANFTLILLLGPILEERHGSLSLLIMILITAVVTGLINIAITNTLLVGASGIVFMMILLASTANIRSREIPLTFIAVAVLFLGREIVNAFREDNVSQLAHLIGGVAGAVFGFLSAPPRLVPDVPGLASVAKVPAPAKPSKPSLAK